MRKSKLKRVIREEVKNILNEKNIGGHYYKEVKKSLLNKEVRDVDLMEISGSGSGVSYNESTQQLVIEFEDGTFAVVSGGARLEDNGTEKHGVLGFDISN